MTSVGKEVKKDMRNKRLLLRITVSAAVISALFCILLLYAGADDSMGEDIKEKYEEAMDAIPEDIKELISDDLNIDGSSLDGLSSSLFEASSRLTDTGNIFDYVCDLIFPSIGELAVHISAVIGLVLLSAISNLVSEHFGERGRIFSVMVRICIMTSVIDLGYKDLAIIEGFFEGMCGFSKAFAPLSFMLWTSVGNVGVAAKSGRTLSIALSFCEYISGSTVFPFFALCMSLALVKALGVGSVSSFSAMIKKVYTFLISAVMLLLSVSLMGQTLISSGADSAAIKGVRFAAGTFIPILGGGLASSVGVISASLGLLKSAVGIIGIAVLLMMLLPVLIRLFAVRAVYSLASSLSGALGCGEESGLFSEIASLYGYFIAISALCSSVYIINMGLLVRVTGAV